MLVRKRPHFPPVGGDDPEQLASLAQRHGQLGPDPVLDKPAWNRIVRPLGRNLGHIFYVKKSLAAHQSGKAEARAKPLPPLGKTRLRAMNCRRPKKLAVVGQQDAVFGAAEAVRPFQYRVEDRREIAGRGVANLQEFGDSGLPCQSLVAFGGAFIELGFEFGDCPPQIGKRWLALYSHSRASGASVLDFIREIKNARYPKESELKVLGRPVLGRTR